MILSLHTPQDYLLAFIGLCLLISVCLGALAFIVYHRTTRREKRYPQVRVYVERIPDWQWPPKDQRVASARLERVA